MKMISFLKQKQLYVICAIFFISALLINYISSPGYTFHDYFVKLAEAFINGRYWLVDDPPWYSELVPVNDSRFYVVYPPMTAILLMPFVYLFGENFPQQYLAHLLTAGITVLTIVMANIIAAKQKKKTPLLIWVGLLAAFGNIMWYMASVGSVWYIGQITAAFFLTGAVVAGLNKKNPIFVGFLLGAAYLSRVHTILSIPLFAYFAVTREMNDRELVKLIKEPKLKKFDFNKIVKPLLMLFLGLLPFLVFNAAYNFIRYGVIWDIGYILIPGLLEESIYRHGIVSPLYIPQNLKVMLWTFPKILPYVPYIQPSWFGLAIWITTPAFIYAFFADIKETVVKAAWMSILPVAIVALIHGGSGWTQFGYRHAVDYYAFLFFLTIMGVARTGLKWHHWALLLIGIVVNLWGVLWINHFGWVSF